MPDRDDLVTRTSDVPLRTSGRERFPSGTVVAGRYRIAALLGAGGMGEVYRADDLTLEHPVALKFLPTGLLHDAAALARFHGEVRTARQVSHPNVCRVFDIGEFAGDHFLSMEYVDGEDLASLLRRIGRLPEDKAIEITRQLCAGVAAAHSAGVLHRDLKPANVMLDGRGRVRITDFGLAIPYEHARALQSFSGTPAYMSPEQAAGLPLTAASDIYALGLVVYEVFTGRRAFAADSAAGYLQAHQRSAPPAPSSHVKDIDPRIERVILRCLEKDAVLRPASALEVASVLPGADPLQAALAAGETPSPEMVAAAGHRIGMRPVAGAACLFALALALVALLVVSPKAVFSVAGLDDPPEVLARKARDITAAVGYPDPPADTWIGLRYDDAYLEHVARSSSGETWASLTRRRPSAARAVYRESPVPLRSLRTDGGGLVTRADPPLTVPGMITMELDGAGRLRRFDAVPRLIEPPLAGGAAFDHGVVFKLAGLEPSDFVPAKPSAGARIRIGEHLAWAGTYPGQPDPSISFEISVAEGRLVHFRIAEPWTRRDIVPTRSEGSEAIFVAVLLSGVVAGASWLAWGNIRRGRGDRRGAFRLAAFIASGSLLSWLLSADHVFSVDEQLVVAQALKDALLQGAIVWLIYLALEPYVRRRWPEALISWSRLLDGRVRDPLVSRDILVGLMTGAALQALLIMAVLTDPAAGLRIARIAIVPLSSLGAYLGWIFTGVLLVQVAMGWFFMVVIARAILRNEWLAGVALLLLVAVPILLQQESLYVSVTLLLNVCVMYFLAIRLGVVALATAMCTSHMLSVPLSGDPSAWFAGYSYTLVGLLLALGIAAFYFAKAGQPLVRTPLLE